LLGIWPQCTKSALRCRTNTVHRIRRPRFRGAPSPCTHFHPFATKPFMAGFWRPGTEDAV